MKKKMKLIFRENTTLLGLLRDETFKKLLNESGFNEIELIGDDRKNSFNYIYEKNKSDLSWLPIIISLIAIAIAVITMIL
ncbi:hypothetical protein [Peptoniphilus obesi]|uniref:hypothetical protein n=1 Tax=Peptoniphilus obesi TaxID=1472765 RepID=UPI0004B05BB7|nr:hypothetical protein [Peptoniphilus obesi]